MQKKSLSLFLLLLIVIFSAGCGLSGVDNTTKKYIRPVTLNYWRVWDGPDDFKEIIDAYTRQHPFVKINYTKLRYEEYEQKLLEGFATDKGPDIFSVHNTWIKKYQSKGMIAAMPERVNMAFPTVKGSVKKEVVWNIKESPMPAPHKLKSDFVDVVYADSVISEADPASGQLQERVYSLPLSVDTMVMFYNKDLFNNAGIITAPEYWNREFQQNIKKLTKQNTKGEIIQSGAALGGSANIVRFSDIVSLLMMQSGSEMMNGKQVAFHRLPATSIDKNYNPGVDALRFYSDFSNPAKEVYSWNDTLENSLDMFVNNKLAIMFGYAYMLPEIKARAPKLNFALAPMPQIEGNSFKVNFANYWGEVVSSKILTNAENLALGSDYARQKSNTAWDFIRFAAEARNAKIYLDKTGKPTALRSLIPEQSKNPEMAIFADQLLTSKSWYRGNNANAMELIFKDMVDSVNSGQNTPAEAVNLAAAKVQQTIEGN
jgi:multiple sugar transport system substrate-binding protein